MRIVGGRVVEAGAAVVLGATVAALHPESGRAIAPAATRVANRDVHM
jgi:hypothetical protein